MKYLFFITTIVFISSCQTNKAPTGSIWEDAWLYHICYKCGSKEGGCYVKNRTFGFRTKQGIKCYHNWEKVDKNTYDSYRVKRENIEYDTMNSKPISLPTIPLNHKRNIETNRTNGSN